MRVTSVLSPAAASRLARHLLFTPAHPQPRDHERAVLARAETFTFTLDDITLPPPPSTAKAPGSLESFTFDLAEANPRAAARRRGGVDEHGPHQVVCHTWGEGPPVLLVHGWGGHAGHMTSLVAPLVALGYRAVAVDLPAHGASTGRYSSLVHAAAAVNRVAALYKPLAGLVAHSFGAAAATLAMARGLEARRVVYFAPAARVEPFWARFRAAVGVPDGVWRRTVRDIEAWLQVRLEDLDSLRQAPRMTAPLLVLHADDDREVPIGDGAALAQAWPRAIWQPVERLGHLRILHDAGCVADAASFIAGQPPGARLIPA